MDFDEIINEQEIECLRNWVDYNRNLAFEKEDMQLLKLVDDVIEDNVITEDPWKKTLKDRLNWKAQKEVSHLFPEIRDTGNHQKIR